MIGELRQISSALKRGALLAEQLVARQEDPDEEQLARQLVCALGKITRRDREIGVLRKALSARGLSRAQRERHRESLASKRAEVNRLVDGLPFDQRVITHFVQRVKALALPVQKADDEIVEIEIAAIGVNGSAEFFTDLARLRTYLVLTGAVVSLLIILITAFVARRITQPLRKLAAEATRIGQGDLEQPVEVASSDEVGLLASTMNEMRKDLHERDQQLQMMLSGIAHEVRNPLGGIALFAGLLRDEIEDPEQLEMVQRIERELEYLKRVVNDFLSYARRHTWSASSSTTWSPT